MSDDAALTHTVRGYKPDRDMPLLEGMAKSAGWAPHDRPFEQILPAVRSKMVTLSDHHWIPEFTPISDQGRAGSCVANGWCDAVEMLLGLKYGDAGVVQLSRRFAYWISRYLHSETDWDNGTYLRSMAHQFRKVGVIPESMMPYSDRHELIVGKTASPKLEHYTAASNNRIKGFYRLSSQGDQLLSEMELAIRSNHPVIIAVEVGRPFLQVRGLELCDVPKTSIGSHCMVVVGFRRDGDRRDWIVRNSWGTYWGDRGHCLLTDAYMKTSSDTWVGTLLEPLV